MPVIINVSNVSTSNDHMEELVSGSYIRTYNSKCMVWCEHAIKTSELYRKIDIFNLGDFSHHERVLRPLVTVGAGAFPIPVVSRISQCSQPSFGLISYSSSATLPSTI